MNLQTAMESSQSGRDLADWNQIAEKYVGNPDDAAVNPMYLQFKAVLWDALGDLHGLHVLDLGCGDGWLSHLMHKAGAKVLGTDGSEQLLAYARLRNRDIEFVQADLAHGLPAGDQTFDRIVSTAVLMDIPILDQLFSDISKRLTNTGKLIFVILHPCFYRYRIHFDEPSQVWYRKVTNYQDPQIWRIEDFGGHNHYHRNLTYYADLLRVNGLAITRLYEPEWHPQPESENAHVVRQWPISLFVEAQPLVRG